MKKLSFPLKKAKTETTPPAKGKATPLKKVEVEATSGITLSVYVPSDLGEAIKSYASKNDRKISYVIKTALEEYIKKHSKG